MIRLLKNSGGLRKRTMRTAKLRAFALVGGFCAALIAAIPCDAAKSKGEVKVLGIRVAFADYNTAPGLASIEDSLQSAKWAFERYSYGVMTITHDKVAVTLNNNRQSYSAGSLADAAESLAKQAGFDPADYNIIGFFHGNHSAGNKAIVGGNRFWTTTGGSIIHEMGHTFGWGHQSRLQPAFNDPLVGTLEKPDPWHFMKRSSIDAEPYEKWKHEWITSIHDIQTDGSFTKRLYTFDQKDIDPANTKRAMRVRRNWWEHKDLWLGFHSRLLPKFAGTGDNYHLRQGIAIYSDRAEVGGSSTALLDMHPGENAFDDHALQPGETFADDQGKVYITNLGRGGVEPNEYIDVQVNRGDFSANTPPVPTWNAPATAVAGEPVTIKVIPNDPEGDAVACMWTTSDKAIPYNTSSTNLTLTFDEGGNYIVKVVVSDMKGKTATLSRTIAVAGDLPATQWKGNAATVFWWEKTNWNPQEQPDSPVAVAAWSSQFTGPNQLSLGSAGSKQLGQIKLASSLTRDVVITMNGLLELFDGGIQMPNSVKDLTIGGTGTVKLGANQTWSSSDAATLSVEAGINLNGKSLTVAPQGVASFAGTVSGGGTLTLDGPGQLTLSGTSTYTGNTVVENGELQVDGVLGSGLVIVKNSGALGGKGTLGGNVTMWDSSVLMPGSTTGIGVLSIGGDLTLNGDLEIVVNPAAAPNCDRINVGGALGGNDTGIISLSKIGTAAYATGQVFQVFNKAFSNGVAKAISPSTPGAGLVWDNRLEIDGSIAVMADTNLISFDEWAQVVSGLSGEQAAFDADPNDDGIINGLAFLLGAPSATNDATALLPEWLVVAGYEEEGTEYPGSLNVTYRRSATAALSMDSHVKYTSDLSGVWTTASNTHESVTISVEPDYYDPGIDQVSVSLSEALGAGGALFGRLVVEQP